MIIHRKQGEKSFIRALVKSIDTDKKTIDVYVSTYEWDRMEERFAPGAWQLDNYKDNPIVMWDHGTSIQRGKLPIGSGQNIAEDEGGLFSRTQFDKADEFSMQVFGLFERKFLNAFSVGFIPKEFKVEPIGDDEDHKGLVWTNAELLEYSAVSIPANPGAVVSREIAELAQRALGKDSVAMIKAFGRDSYIAMPADGKLEAKSLQSFLKSLAPKEGDEVGLDVALKAVLEMARAAKGDKVPEGQLSLLKTAGDLFQDIIRENSEDVSREDFDALHEAVKSLGEAAALFNKDQAELIRKAMLQIKKAL